MPRRLPPGAPTVTALAGGATLLWLLGRAYPPVGAAVATASTAAAVATRERVMSGAVAYMASLAVAPLQTKIATSAVLFTLSDVLAQVLAPPPPSPPPPSLQSPPALGGGGAADTLSSVATEEGGVGVAGATGGGASTSSTSVGSTSAGGLLAGVAVAAAKGGTGKRHRPLSHRVVLRRAVLFGAWGALLATPALHVWYGLLAGVAAGQGLAAALATAVVDQACFTPVYVVSYFGWEEATGWLLRGSSPTAVASVAPGGTTGRGIAAWAARVTRRVRADARAVILQTWAFWLPANAFNFAVVPLELRLLYVNVVAILWNVYFCLLVRRRMAGGGGGGVGGGGGGGEHSPAGPGGGGGGKDFREGGYESVSGGEGGGRGMAAAESKETV
ncbi:hypothetical protein MMPV_002315 [Pyropia vietnamensis]